MTSQLLLTSCNRPSVWVGVVKSRRMIGSWGWSVNTTFRFGRENTSWMWQAGIGGLVGLVVLPQHLGAAAFLFFLCLLPLGLAYRIRVVVGDVTIEVHNLLHSSMFLLTDSDTVVWLPGPREHGVRTLGIVTKLTPGAVFASRADGHPVMLRATVGIGGRRYRERLAEFEQLLREKEHLGFTVKVGEAPPPQRHY